MRALVVYCHPSPDSFSAAVRDVVLDRLKAAEAEGRMHDLYASGIQPILTQHEWTGYLHRPANRAPVGPHVSDLEWCDRLIFVCPNGWYGLPAMLKGWLERVLLPAVAFVMPKGEGDTIKPGLTHITRLGVFTTCGASWRLTLMRGVGLLLAPRARKVCAAQFLMDSAGKPALGAHLRKVAAAVDRLAGPVRARDAKGPPA